MPRKKIKLEHSVEYLSILDEKGKPDKDLDPKIDKDTLLRMHRTMLLSRRFDEYQLRWQKQGRIGTFAPAKGQEASQIGSIAAVEDDDWMVPSFRETSVALWRGTPMSGLLLFNAGYNEGGEIPEDQNDLPISIPVASQIIESVGIAYALKRQKKDRLAVSYFGDGATSEGDFHEALNFAQVFNTPNIFICQNNQYAISVPREQQTESRTLAQKALAYGMPGIQVDGNDPLAVYTATREAAERARKGDGPTLIECLTYRLSVHTTADDPGKYRDEEEEERWEEWDPIPRFQQYLKDRRILRKKDIDALEEEIDNDVKSAWDEAEKKIKSLGDPLVMFDHLFEERPAYIEEQRQAMKQYREDNDG